ncbi:MAG: hypothetical protein KGO53_07635 [Alphaproteobacteria bacterium]|nr:hypothetical protein [Alphaproteobacteria bacterium]
MLSKIRLELARMKGHPEGEHNIAYEFTAPLDAKGHIDVDAWHKLREQCRVVRKRPQEADEVGHLVRKPGGSWAFHYDIHGPADDDESGYRFGAHAFTPGEYVSIREEDDELLTFKVVRVQPVA